MSEIPLILMLTLFLSLLYAFTNGARDSGNAIATLISERIVSPRTAVLICAGMNLLGALLGTAVALTVAKGLIHIRVIADYQTLALSALTGAILWHGITRFLNLPSSSFHGLIGGLGGAAVASGGWQALQYETICRKVLLPIVFTPLGGFFPEFPDDGRPGAVDSADAPAGWRLSLPEAAACIVGSDGLKSRDERCPESSRGNHHGPVFLPADSSGGDIVLGPDCLCTGHGSGDHLRRHADYPQSALQSI